MRYDRVTVWAPGAQACSTAGRLFPQGAKKLVCFHTNSCPSWLMDCSPPLSTCRCFHLTPGWLSIARVPRQIKASVDLRQEASVVGEAHGSCRWGEGIPGVCSGWHAQGSSTGAETGKGGGSCAAGGMAPGKLFYLPAEPGAPGVKASGQAQQVQRAGQAGPLPTPPFHLDPLSLGHTYASLPISQQLTNSLRNLSLRGQRHGSLG